MTINLPDNAAEVDSRAKTDVQRELTGSNPFLKNHWLGAIVTAFSNRIFDFYLQLKVFLKELFWNTSTGEFLEIQASWFAVNRLAATQSIGNIVLTGTDTTIISISTEFKTSDGLSFLTTSLGTVSAQSISISSITRSGDTVTVTTTSNHNLASNVVVTVSGAVETDYNGAQIIKVTGADTFTYVIATTPTTPATGTILAGFTSANVPVQSSSFGQGVNLDFDSVLSVTTPISGLDSDGNVDFGELGGGADQESDTTLRTRFLDRVQNPIAHFNVAEITAKAKEIAGVTRVFVQEVTPSLGEVTIYFMRDDDPDPIPSAGEITTVKNNILTIKPANTDDVDVIVAAPTGVTTAFTFSALSPNTDTMKAAITASLEQFYSESVNVGENIKEDAYRSAIFNTVDTETGNTEPVFTLSAPTADIIIATGEIGLLGAITYP